MMMIIIFGLTTANSEWLTSKGKRRERCRRASWPVSDVLSTFFLYWKKYIFVENILFYALKKIDDIPKLWSARLLSFCTLNWG